LVSNPIAAKFLKALVKKEGTESSLTNLYSIKYYKYTQLLMRRQSRI